MNKALLMRRCLDLARLGKYDVAPNPMVGAVLVDESGTILAEGWHKKFGEAHAERDCIQNFEKSGCSIPYSACTLVVNLEPCSHWGHNPPCCDLIIEKGIKKVIVGCLDPNPLVAGQGLRKLQEAGIEVENNVLEQECKELNKRFMCLYEKKRPYITLKWAQTKDGFLDTIRTDSTHQPLVISTPLTKQLVHKLRAENMGIMVGTNTVVLDNPRLLNTHWCGHHPTRITVDCHHRIPPQSRILTSEAPTIVYQTSDLSTILADLYDRKIHSILVEGGSRLLQSFIQAGLYDEIHIEESQQTLIQSGVPAPNIPLENVSATRLDGNYLLISKNGQ